MKETAQLAQGSDGRIAGCLEFRWINLSAAPFWGEAAASICAGGMGHVCYIIYFAIKQCSFYEKFVQMYLRDPRKTCHEHYRGIREKSFSSIRLPCYALTFLLSVVY